jgi:hypothetical protein
MVSPSLIAAVPILLFASCKPEIGSVEGSIYWKDNYVGNKPDAGSEITIYHLSDITRNIWVMCDA